MSATREGFTVAFKREVAEFAEANPDWPNTEVGKKFGVPTEYVRRWRIALQDRKLDRPGYGSPSRSSTKGSKGRTNGSNGSNGRKETAETVPETTAEESKGVYRVEGLEQAFETLNEAKQAALEAVFEERLTDIRITQEVVTQTVVFNLVKPE